MNRLEALIHEARADKWIQRFAIFCRVMLALGFLIGGYVKIIGERFASGLPSNNPLGHYFDALHITGFYYTFIGIGQIIAAVLLLIPRTSLLGALMYFPIILNICVLTYATRFDSTGIVTVMLLANLFLLIWDYDRLKHLLLIRHITMHPPIVIKPLGKFLRPVFFGLVLVQIVAVMLCTFYLFEIRPGNSEAECRNQCANSKNPAACQTFCDCIYKQGKPLDSCLATFNKAKDIRKQPAK